MVPLDPPSVVSPYRINPQYRPPRPNAGESDHGYSTMTPHDDMDTVPYHEPLLAAPPRQYAKPPEVASLASASVLSTSSCASSEMPTQTRLIDQSFTEPQQTLIPDKDGSSCRFVVADVQVHMVDNAC